jgi:hypothetical protein
MWTSVHVCFGHTDATTTDSVQQLRNRFDYSVRSLVERLRGSGSDTQDYKSAYARPTAQQDGALLLFCLHKSGYKLLFPRLHASHVQNMVVQRFVCCTASLLCVSAPSGWRFAQQ